MAWVLWLAVPVLTPVLVACVVWVRSRPPKAVAAEDAMRQHQDYLAALVAPARGTRRVDPVDLSADIDN